MGAGDIVALEPLICGLAPLLGDNLRDPESSSLHDGCASAGHPDCDPE